MSIPASAGTSPQHNAERRSAPPLSRPTRRSALAAPTRRPLTPAHAMVLSASERAMQGHGRSVALPEIVQALRNSEQRALRAKYPTQTLTNAVHKIVAQLLTTERLVDVGRLGAHRFVATPEIQLAGLGGLPAAPLDVQRQVPLKPTHELVRQACEIANLAAGRAVAIHEIVAALEPSSRAVLEDAYATRPLGELVKKVVDRLCARGLVLCPGRESASRYYVAAGALPAEQASTLPNEPSRRARVAQLVHHAVVRLGRAVRFIDVVEQSEIEEKLPQPALTECVDAAGFDEHASEALDGVARRALSRHEIAVALQSLVRTAHLSTPYLTRGGAQDGDALYLPAGLPPAKYAPRVPLTWLDFVVDTLGQLWQERIQAADAQARQPRPFTTAELRDVLQRRANEEPALVASLGLEDRRGDRSARVDLTSWTHGDGGVVFEAQAVANALQSLATGEAAVVRRVIAVAESAGNLWVPATIADEELDVGSAFANDAARIAEAVRRACLREDVPAASRVAVEKEVARDAALRPGGRRSVAQVLADAAKETLSTTAGTSERVTQRVAHVGRVDTTVFYSALSAGDEEPARHAGVQRSVVAANAYVALRQIEHDMQRLDLPVTLAAIRSISLACVAIGRVRLLGMELGTLFVAAEAVRGEVGARSRDVARASEISDRLQLARAQVAELAATAEEHWASELQRVRSIERESPALVLPSVVDVQTPGWTAEELMPHLTMLYPRSTRAGSPTELIALLSGRIRRVPNPDYVARRQGGRAGAERLFDQCAARVTIANQWGGRHAIMQASIATETLGKLRDPRFVVPALWHHDAAMRLAGIACAAYLGAPEAHHRLADLARRDREPGLRAAAAWAYGFVGGAHAAALLEDLRDDPHALPRRLAHAALAMQPLNWWQL